MLFMGAYHNSNQSPIIFHIRKALLETVNEIAHDQAMVKLA